MLERMPDPSSQGRVSYENISSLRRVVELISPRIFVLTQDEKVENVSLNLIFLRATPSATRPQRRDEGREMVAVMCLVR